MPRTPTIRCWSSTSWSPSRSTDRTGPAGSSWAARTSWPARARHRTAGSSRGSSGTTPRCPGTRSGCGSPRSSETARWARRAPSPVAPASAWSRPAGVTRACCTRRGTPPAGGTCTRSTAPTGWPAPPGAWRRWTRRSAARPGSSVTRRMALPMTAPSLPLHAVTAAPSWSGSVRMGSRCGSTRRGRTSGASGCTEPRRSRRPPGRTRARSSSAWTPAPARRSGCSRAR